MIYHVLPGEAQLAAFNQTKLNGQVVVFSEALVTGPLEAADLDEFWQQRARFILAEYGEDEIAYHEKVADPINRLADLTSDDEVNLWFEYELFCSVNMWFCLNLIKPTNAAVYRIEPIGLAEEDRWDGFAKFTADDLNASYELRTQFSSEEITLGTELWD